MRYAFRTVPVRLRRRLATTPSRRLAQTVIVALSLLASAAPALAPAAELRVRVFERGGRQPLAGAAVCLGTSANITQFGAYQTDREGYAVFADVPRAPLLVTASKSGYQGEQQSLVTTTVGRLLVMSLAAGGGGPLCTTAGSRAALDGGGLQVTKFNINQGAAAASNRQVHLNYVVSGHPNQYRVSENPDISNAPWQPYSAEPVFTLTPGNGKKTVYLQVRRYSKINGADIQAVSPVVHDSIVLQGQ
jgi:hypothetical protein